MDYAEWIREQHMRSVAVEQIAEAALDGPALCAGDSESLAPLMRGVSQLLAVPVADVQIVGSARFGFSLRDGAAFDPAFSDLDLAIVNAGLYQRCSAPTAASADAARFPERDFPADERIAVRKAFDALSLSVADRFAYVSVAVFPDQAALVRAQAERMRAYLGVAGPAPAARQTGAAPAGAVETPFQRIVDAGLPQYMLPITASTPGNASPWLADLAAFQHAFGGSALRQVRLVALQRALADLAQVVQVQCCLVGGSFVDVSNAVPNDLDIVVFYRARADVRFEPGRALQRLTRKFLLEHIDMRFVPCDAEPWMMVKLTSYFTQLYQSRRPGTEAREHGLVLLLPGTGTGQ
ncbi:hypothetical protein I5W16_11870 [Stenotrophomonas maltophilia]|nr:hypothetical protein [Stenotrophomonas maltophilia]MBH1823274.1 hypothetical protein [Stenotrophomonas maltophilia]